MGLPIILTDIEGTTSSVRFVHEVLFPYADRRLPDFVARHEAEPEVRAALNQAGAELAVDPARTQDIVAGLRAWIAEDRKATSLKAIQGLIWREGYSKGDFQAHIYPDALERLKHWHRQGCLIYVYSSGSIQAQKLYFAHTTAGDLTSLFTGYFDTTIGPKKERDSYLKIAERIGFPRSRIVFLSDMEAELDAAAQAGLPTVWVCREGDLPASQKHRVARSFADIDPALLVRALPL